MCQGAHEPLRSYLGRFNKEKIEIPRCDVATAVEAFRHGLIRDSDLYKELTRHPCSSFEDVQAKALAQIRLEEDLNARISVAGYNKVERKTSQAKDQPRYNPYSKPGRSDVNVVDNMGGSNQ